MKIDATLLIPIFQQEDPYLERCVRSGSIEGRVDTVLSHAAEDSIR